MESSCTRRGCRKAEARLASSLPGLGGRGDLVLTDRGLASFGFFLQC